MLKPRIGKVTVNVSVGKSGEQLDKAMKVLEDITWQKSCTRKAKKAIRDFGIRKNEPIACLVTLRKEKANEFLKKVFKAVDNTISKSSFDNTGLFSFGIKEHIDIPGTKYVPELGIIGMDVSVTMERRGYRVKRKHRTKSKIGSNHLLKTEDSIQFVKENFGVEIV